MTRYTDCEARGVVTPGCSCTFCRDRTVVDGKRVRVPLMMMDTAGVPIREDALSPHERAMRGEQRSPEEIERDRRQQAEARQQAETANRTARQGDEWDKALAKVNRAGGGIREAAFSRV